jgi:hypothetical protein
MANESAGNNGQKQKANTQGGSPSPLEMQRQPEQLFLSVDGHQQVQQGGVREQQQQQQQQDSEDRLARRREFLREVDRIVATPIGEGVGKYNCRQAQG